MMTYVQGCFILFELIIWCKCIEFQIDLYDCRNINNTQNFLAFLIFFVSLQAKLV